jgi:hypothetical protein
VDAAALTRLIGEAFGALASPGDDALVLGDSVESVRVRAALAGRAWQDVSAAEIAGPLRDALGTLAPAAYRYYLPAFMTAVVNDFDACADAADGVVHSLTAPRRSDVEDIQQQGRANPELQPFGRAEWDQILATLRAAHETLEQTFATRMSGLDPRQADAVRAFLEHLASEHPADFARDEPRVALERHWAAGGGG